MRKFINNGGVPLSMAVFLANDTYDHNTDSNTISATTLLKPLRQIILSKRLPEEMQVIDVITLVKSRMGQAIHDAIERAWKEHHIRAMSALGYPERVIRKVIINPDPDEVTEDDIPVYLEQRSYRDVGEFRVSGKYDFVADGRIEDFKSTSTYTWINGNKTDDYMMQGSLYRWLNPQIVTQDHMAIQFIFTDWSAPQARANPAYPQKAVEQLLIPLLSVDQTEQFVRNKLNDIRRYENTPEKLLPLCSDKELWRSEPSWKYYKNPDKRARSTKNFDNKLEAYQRLAEDGNVGVVVEVPGQVTACKYCPVFPICTQKDALIAEGSLIL